MSLKQRIAARVCISVATAFALTGCIKVDMDLTIASDNTASGSATVGIDKRLLQLSGQTVEDFLRAANISAPDGAEDASTKRYEDETFIGQTVMFEGASLSELNGSGDSGDLQIVRQGDQFHVSGLLDLNLPEDSGTGDPQVDQVAKEAIETAEIRIRLTFPGEVTSSNGMVEGNSVTWRPTMGESMQIRAVASAVESSTSPVIWIAIGAVVLIALAAIFLVLSRRKSAADAAEEGGATPGPPPPDVEAVGPPSPTFPTPPGTTEHDEA